MTLLTEPSADIRMGVQKNVLTPEQEITISTHIDVIKRNQYKFTDTGMKQTMDAEQEILTSGNRVLPYLKDKLADHAEPHLKNFSEYKFSLFASALAEEHDLDLILSCIQPFEDTSEPFSKTLSRLLYSIRKKNPLDNRLEAASKKLIEIASQCPDGIDKYYLVPLALTGTHEAGKFIQNQPDDFEDLLQVSRNELLIINNDYKEIPHEFVERYHFISWAEFNGNHSRLKEESKTEEREAETSREVLEDIPLGSTDNTNYTTSKEVTSVVKQVEDVIKTFLVDADPTALPAIRLYLYNYFSSLEHQNTPEELLSVIAKVERLSELEKKARTLPSPLPTIGIEIEFPRKRLTPDRSEALENLGIPNYLEHNEYLWEVNPDFTYNPILQARILQELTKLGLFPLEDIQLGRKVIPNWANLSLHVNLGIPPEIATRVLEEHKHDVYQLNDILTYAFASPYRIAHRKTSTSVRFDKEASVSEKTRASSSQMFRLELRAGEFRDYPTFKMLVDAQRLSAMLFSYLKSVEGKPLSASEQRLATLWDEFSFLTKAVIDKYNMLYNHMDYAKNKVSNILKDTDLKQDCRKLVTLFSKKVHDALEETPDEERIPFVLPQPTTQLVETR